MPAGKTTTIYIPSLESYSLIEMFGFWLLLFLFYFSFLLFLFLNLKNRKTELSGTEMVVGTSHALEDFDCNE